jgi:hypothetical protein
VRRELGHVGRGRTKAGAALGADVAPGGCVGATPRRASAQRWGRRAGARACQGQAAPAPHRGETGAPLGARQGARKGAGQGHALGRAGAPPGARLGRGGGRAGVRMGPSRGASWAGLGAHGGGGREEGEGKRGEAHLGARRSTTTAHRNPT